MFEKYDEFKVLAVAIEAVRSKAQQLERGDQLCKTKAAVLNPLLQQWDAAIMTFNGLDFESLPGDRIELHKQLLRTVFAQSILGLSELSMKTIATHRDSATIALRAVTWLTLATAGAVGGALLGTALIGGPFLAIPGVYAGYKAGGRLIEVQRWWPETLKLVSAVLNSLPSSFKDNKAYGKDFTVFLRQLGLKNAFVWITDPHIDLISPDKRYLHVSPKGQFTCTEVINTSRRTYTLNPFVHQPESCMSHLSMFADPHKRFRGMDETLLRVICMRAAIAYELEIPAPELEHVSGASSSYSQA